jgi:hypothetical protein
MSEAGRGNFLRASLLFGGVAVPRQIRNMFGNLAGMQLSLYLAITTFPVFFHISGESTEPESPMVCGLYWISTLMNHTHESVGCAFPADSCAKFNKIEIYFWLFTDKMKG